MIKEILKKVVKGNSLSIVESQDVMEYIMGGNATPSQIAGLITALRMKNESIDEITGFAKAMRSNAEKIVPNINYYIDTCGTGGDGSNTFNISTAVAFVAAAAGVVVAKHGNRSISSKSGSSDVLQSLGVNIDIEPTKVKECIEAIGIGFMFAPKFHKSMKYAALPRQELGIRTIFNVLGPLTNPAMAKGQILGVFDSSLTNPMANVLNKLGVERAMVVHGKDGLDEITITDNTIISEVKDGMVKDYEIDPNEFSLKDSSEELIGGDSKVNAQIIIDIFKGEKGPRRNIVILNGAAALYVGKKVDNLADGIKICEEVIDTGKVLTKVEEMKKFTNN